MADETETPAEETKPATAAETAAAQAVKSASQKGMTAEEAKAADTTKALETQGEATSAQLEQPMEDNELHVASDLMAASQNRFGVPPETVAGALHHAGLEMTSEIRVAELAAHIQAFLALPA